MIPDTRDTKLKLQSFINQPLLDWKEARTDCSFPSYVVKTLHQVYFIKYSEEPTEAFLKEATGLEQLRRFYKSTPEVFNVSSECLVLNYIENHDPTKEFWQRLGSGLAEMHQVAQGSIGFYEDNFIGRATQRNTGSYELNDWASFFWNNRIDYKLEQIQSRYQDQFKPSLLKVLKSQVSEQLSAHEPLPSLLHGDLWNGNILCGPKQEAYVIDPAVYFGDRETDIAMTECFGGFPEEFYQAYNSTHPLDSGYEQRKHIYNLYHMLNHYLIFGDSYKMSCLKIMEMIVS